MPPTILKMAMQMPNNTAYRNSLSQKYYMLQKNDTVRRNGRLENYEKRDHKFEQTLKKVL